MLILEKNMRIGCCGVTHHMVCNTTTSNPHVSSANSSAIRLEERADLGSYGYTSEVVLICFCVMFGLLFLGMVGKYYQLKKNIGDYRLQQVI